MKKILTTLVGGAILASTLSADFARIEAGAGSWVQTPSGDITTTATSDFLNLDGIYRTSEDESAEMYAWVLIKHPIPFVPNLRLEYVSLTDSGNFDRYVEGQYAGKSPTTIDMKQFDIIPYYNLIDNTFWITVDVGLDIKVIQSDVKVEALGNETGSSLFDGVVNSINSFLPAYETTDTTPIPLLYLRGRVEIPTTNIGVESDIKFITDGDNTVYDIRAKVDYTFDISPVIQPAVEVGYRTQKFEVDTDDTYGTLEYSGMYAGVMLRF